MAEPFDKLAQLFGGSPSMGMSPTVTPARTPDPFNNRVPPKSLPYEDRFAGGFLKSQYSPYNGDPSRYGFGPQHRYYTPDTTAWTTGAGTGTGTGTGETEAEKIARNEAEAQSQQIKGGPSPGEPGPAPDPFNAGGFSRDWGKLMDMVMGVSPSVSIANMVSGGYTGLGPSTEGMGMGYSGGWDSSAEGQEGAAVEAESKGEAASGNVDAQALAKGGSIKGDKNYGVDDVTIKADGGEFMIRAKEAQKIGNTILERLNQGHYDLTKLKGAVSGKGLKAQSAANQDGRKGFRAYSEGGEIEEETDGEEVSTDVGFNQLSQQLAQLDQKLDMLLQEGGMGAQVDASSRSVAVEPQRAPPPAAPAQPPMQGLADGGMVKDPMEAERAQKSMMAATLLKQLMGGQLAPMAQNPAESRMLNAPSQMGDPSMYQPGGRGPQPATAQVPQGDPAEMSRMMQTLKMLFR